MLEHGFVKIYRSLLNWEWYGDINTKTVFLHLLLTANYEPKKWRGEVINPGERVISLQGLSQETKLSIQKVRTAISHLKSTGEITQRKAAGAAILTVKNYARFQETTRDITSKDHVDSMLSTCYQHQNNNNVRNKERNKKVKEVVLPTFEQIFDFVKREHLNVDAVKFFEHYQKNEWTTREGKPVTDWQALLRRWSSKEQKPYAGGYQGIRNLADDDDDD